MRDSSDTSLILALLYALLIGIIAYIRYLLLSRRASKFFYGGTPPLPKVIPHYPDAATMRYFQNYVQKSIEAFKQIPWGQSPVTSVEEGQRLYDEAMAIATQTEGDHQGLTLAIEKFVYCPPALAYSGAAEVMRRISYIGGYDYVREGIQAAGRYTSLAVASDPSSPEAWIMRVRVFCATPDIVYRKIARYALKQARKIAPTHPRFAGASALYYKAVGNRLKREAALKIAVRTAPTLPERLAAYNSLALHYLHHSRVRKAILTFQQAQQEFPQGSAWFWHNYSSALNAAKRYQDALTCSDRALTFFEFPRARKINNQLRSRLGLAPQKSKYQK